MQREEQACCQGGGWKTFESIFTYCPSQELVEARDQLEESESRRLKVRPDKRYYHINQMIMMILSFHQGEPRHELFLRLPAPLLLPPVHSRLTLRQTARLLCLSPGGQAPQDKDKNKGKDKDKDKDKDICLSSGGQAPRALKSKSLFSGLERTRWRPACSFPWRGLQPRSGRRAGRGRVGPILQVVKPLDL